MASQSWHIGHSEGKDTIIIIIIIILIIIIIIIIIIITIIIGFTTESCRDFSRAIYAVH